MIGADKEFYELLKTEGIPFELSKPGKSYLISLQYHRLDCKAVKNSGLLITVGSEEAGNISSKKIIINKKAIDVTTFEYDILKKIKRILYGMHRKGIYYTDSCSLSKNPKIPIADLERKKITGHILDFCYEKNIPLPTIWYFPKSKFTYSLTHDTDVSSDSQAKELVELEERHKIKSTFFIFEPSFSVGMQKQLMASGFDIEQHPTLTRDLFLNVSKRTGINVCNSAKRVEKFLKKTKGNRTHELLWFNGPKYASLLKKNMVEWDSTFGYNFKVGYAFGTGLPYDLWGLTEFPIIIHDVALNKKGGEYIGEFKEFIENCQDKEYFTNFNIIYHSAQYLPKRFLEEIIFFMKKNGIEHMKLNDYHNWWTKRNMISAKLKKSGNVLSLDLSLNGNVDVILLILKTKKSRIKKNIWNIRGREFIINPVHVSSHKNMLIN